MIKTSLRLNEQSKEKAEEIKKALPFLKSFGAVVEYSIAHVYEEITNEKNQNRQQTTQPVNDAL